MLVEESDDEYDVLNSDNVRTFSWRGKNNVNVCKCLHKIPLLGLTKCQSTLTKVWFQYPLLVENIKTVLLHCPNLIDLSFEDILVNEYHPPSSPQVISQASSSCTDPEVVTHQKLEILEITTSLPRLSYNEYWVLDYLSRNTLFPNLKIFTFWKNLKRISPRPVLETNEVIELFGKQILSTPNIIAKFILKHKRTLKSLWLGGTGFKLFNNGVDTDDPLFLSPERQEDIQTLTRALKKVQLDSYTCTFSGDCESQQLFLEHQRKLKKLILFSRFEISPSQPQLFYGSFMTRFLNCIARNTDTLTEIILYPKIVYPGKDRAELLGQLNFLEHFTINCDIFQSCHSLENLSIGLLTFQELSVNAEGWPTLIGARLLNIHRIPSQTLSELQLFAEDYSTKEWKQLEVSLCRFTNLQKFSLSSSPLKPRNEFLVRLKTVKVLSNLPNIEEFSFFNFEFENPEAVRQFVRHPLQKSGSCSNEDGIEEEEVIEVRVTYRNVIQTYGLVEGVTFKVSRRIM